MYEDEEIKWSSQPAETGVPGTYSGASSGQVTQKKNNHVVRMNHIWNYCILSFCTHARRHVCPHSDVLLNLTVAAILSRVHTSTVFCGCTIFSCLWLSRWQWFVLISASTKQCLFFSSLPLFFGSGLCLYKYFSRTRSDSLETLIRT